MELTDYNGVKILSPEPTGLGGKTIQDNFKALADAKANAVQSVNGRIGAVNLLYSDVGAAASIHTHTLWDTTNLQPYLDGKANLSGATFTGDVHVVGGRSLLLGGVETGNTEYFYLGDRNTDGTIRIGQGTGANAGKLIAQKRVDGAWGTETVIAF